MADQTMGKLKPVHWVLISGAALILGLLLWARRTNIMANVSQDIIARVSQAIANAEGFNVEGSRPARNHNPGDLTQDLTGKAVGKDPNGFVIYANDQDGFDALAAQVRNFFSGSTHYNPSMSILQTSKVYSPEKGNNVNVWALNVASYLGVDINTTWSELA